MDNNTPNILVLGATGMLGKVVFKFLKSRYPNTTWGTARSRNEIKNHMLYLNTSSIQRDFDKILGRLKSIDFVINCIAQLDLDNKISEGIITNALFPHHLEKLSEKCHIKLIQVSTDAVFPANSKKASEKSIPCAESAYAASKLLGELYGKNSMTIRSSFLGSSSKSKGSFFQKALKEKTVEGFTNQKWSGSTTLQFAKFCHFLTLNNNYNKLRKKSTIYHFVPLSTTTRYDILRNLSKINKDIKIRKKQSLALISRTLVSDFFDKKFYSSYTTNIQQALQELFQFEKTMKND